MIQIRNTKIFGPNKIIAMPFLSSDSLIQSNQYKLFRLIKIRPSHVKTYLIKNCSFETTWGQVHNECSQSGGNTGNNVNAPAFQSMSMLGSSRLELTSPADAQTAFHGTQMSSALGENGTFTIPQRSDVIVKLTNASQEFDLNIWTTFSKRWYRRRVDGSRLSRGLKIVEKSLKNTTESTSNHLGFCFDLKTKQIRQCYNYKTEVKVYILFPFV